MESIASWTAAEESAFAQIMAAGGLLRLESIRLYRRSRGDLAKALQIAADNRRVPATPAQIAARERSSTNRANTAQGQGTQDTQLTLIA
jgi:hypothetical protein